MQLFLMKIVFINDSDLFINSITTNFAVTLLGSGINGNTIGIALRSQISQSSGESDYSSEVL
jgi:hypothetical protein